MNSNHPLGMELGNRRYEASPWFENPNSARPQGGADSLIQDYEEEIEECNNKRPKAGFLRDDYSDLLDRTDRILRGDDMDKPASRIYQILSGLRFIQDDVIQVEPYVDSQILLIICGDIEKLEESGIDLPSFRAIEQYQN